MPANEVDQSQAGSSRWVLLVMMCVGYFLVLLDVTIVNVALPTIGTGLDAGVSALQWVVDGYALALAAVLLAGGTIGDLSGHKRVVLTGLAVFGLASAAGGLAPSSGALIGARAVQGVRAALLLTGTLAIITHAFPERGEQARAIGIWASVGSVALPAGPLLGGALVTNIGWRVVFFINVPIVTVAGTVAARVVHESQEAHARRLRPTPQDRWEQVQRELTAGPAWILDGDLGPHDSLQPRIARADTVVILDLGVLRCAWRVTRRSRERADFWWWLVAWRRRSRPKILAAIDKWAPSADVHILRSPGRVDEFLAKAPRPHR